MLIIGLMSGTSADGVDAALVEWPEGEAARPFQLVSFAQSPFDDSLQERIHALAAGSVPGPDALRELATLDVLLGERFAEAAEAAVAVAGIPIGRVRAIASHGQTVGHFPEARATLQIGDPSVIAERTGCTTVADFRPRDVAAGGEGAPLAPFFHLAAFADDHENRVALNLGGIANLTWLPRGGNPDEVLAFDVGPANALVDGVMTAISAGVERMDRDGRQASEGRVDEGLLEELLDDSYLRQSPPKSTGRERYGRAEAETLAQSWKRAGKRDADLIRSLVAFTAEAVARACFDLLPRAAGGTCEIHRLLVGGGGAANPVLMKELSERLPDARVEPFDVAGVPIQAAEAMAFSLMGRNTLLGLPNHLPQCSGAARLAVLGEIVPGAGGQV
jgi:anhydro-N-acetylmuramic acid kinase